MSDMILPFSPWILRSTLILTAKEGVKRQPRGGRVLGDEELLPPRSPGSVFF